MKLALAVGIPCGLVVGLLLWAQVNLVTGAFSGISTGLLAGYWARTIFEES